MDGGNDPDTSQPGCLLGREHRQIAQKKDDDDNTEITLHDLAFPATTNSKQLVAQNLALQANSKKATASTQMTVVFSTYQSIDAVAKAQKAGLPEFDLIICDEAHRTTGVTLTGRR